MPAPRDGSVAVAGHLGHRRGSAHLALLVALLGGLTMAAGMRPPGRPPVAQHPPWRLIWADEFSGRAGSPVDPTRWSAEVGGDGWGNQELEYYTGRVQNAHRDGHGHLAIVARKETLPASSCWYGTCLYTSARLISKGHFAFRYGRVEARIKIPSGIGYWPAFWMLGTNIDSAGWPACGEVDIMENVGQEPHTVHGSAHGPGYSGGDGLTMPFALLTGRPFAAAFHTFALEWEPGALRWYVDGRLYETQTPADLPPGAPWVYDHPFFLLLNVAVGGQWPGDPLPSTVFPQPMLVDYVRVYQHATASTHR
jgi:beta-glucanase (GH16 family)